jgi:hypothetical protein
MSQYLMHFQFNPNQLLHMLQMQNGFNRKVIGHDWMDGRTHKHVDFCTAMSVEASEFAEHMGFKWWKNQQPDVPQAKMELIDIFHFLISRVMESCGAHIITDLEMHDVERPKGSDLTDMTIARAMALLQGAYSQVYSTCGAGAQNRRLYEEIELAMRKVNVNRLLRKMVHHAELVECEDEAEAMDNLAQSCRVFFTVLTMMQMNFAELYLLYLGKNVLNRFRQNNGYKSGAYVKTWGVEEGKQLEDNDSLFTYVNTLLKLDNLDESVDYEALIYTHLEREYAIVRASQAKSA